MNVKKWGLAFGATIGLAFATPQFAQAATQEDVFVVYKNDAGKQAIMQQALSITKDFEAFQTIEGAFTDEALKLLQQNDDIHIVEKEATTYETANVDTSTLKSISKPLWNVTMIGVQTPWQQGLSGQGVNVAVLDTGVAEIAALNHVTALSFVNDDPQTATNEATPKDVEGHGTAVTSIIAGGKQTITDGTFVGIAPNAKVYSLKVFDRDGAEMSTILSAVEWSIKNGMDILNMSLGAEEADPILKRAVSAANAAGLTIVAATGNESSFTRVAPVDYPAAYSGVIGVGSVDASKERSYFSNGGEAVDFVAPGEDVRVLSLKGSTMLESGTSFSAPHVTAMLALLKERYPTYSTAQLQTLLKQYSEDLGAKGHDVLYGDGLVKLTNLPAVATTTPVVNTPTVPVDEDGSSLPTESNTNVIETQNDAQKFISAHQYDITKVISKIAENQKLTLGLEFTKVYSLYNHLAKPEQTYIKQYNKKLKTVVVSSSTKSSKLSANNLTKMAKEKTTQLKFTTAIKPSSLTASRIYVYKDGAKVTGFQLKKAASGKAIRLTFPKDLKAGNYVIMVDPTNLKTKTGKKITTPFAVKFTVK